MSRDSPLPGVNLLLGLLLFSVPLKAKERTCFLKELF